MCALVRRQPARESSVFSSLKTSEEVKNYIQDVALPLHVMGSHSFDDFCAPGRFLLAWMCWFKNAMGAVRLHNQFALVAAIEA